MSQPDDVSQSAWDVAGPISGENELRRIAVARAIDAEREACAVRAEGFTSPSRDWVPGSLMDGVRREIAASIRNGGAK